MHISNVSSVLRKLGLLRRKLINAHTGVMLHVRNTVIRTNWNTQALSGTFSLTHI